MDYEKVILELLCRIQTLEEQVHVLMKQQETNEETRDEKVTTNDIREYITKCKVKAKAEGRTTLTLLARDIHRELGLKQRYPMVCNAMRDCMQTGDEILFQPPKGNSSTLEIQYRLH